MSKILLVEDDDAIAKAVQSYLVSEHHIVDVACDGDAALERLQSFQYELVILDWNLPGGISGVDVLRHIRSKLSSARVIMLTANADIESRANGLDAGADDYMVKPFHTRELGARIRAVLRRPTVVQDGILAVGEFRVDTVAHKLTRQGLEVQLRPMEYKLAEFFFRHPKRLFSTEELLANCWSDDSEISIEAIYTTMRRLRKALDQSGKSSIIRTVHSQGYILDCD